MGKGWHCTCVLALCLAGVLELLQAGEWGMFVTIAVGTRFNKSAHSSLSYHIRAMGTLRPREQGIYLNCHQTRDS